MNQAGLPTFGLSGVDGGHDLEAKAQAEDRCDKESYHLLSPIKECAEKAMEICVVFDYPDMDGANPQVIRAAVRTLKMAQRANGVPMISYVSGKGSEKVGVDDYYVSLADVQKRQAQFVEEIDNAARPAAPNECLKWIFDGFDDGFWDKAAAKLDLKRAALIAGAWFDTPKALRGWIRKLAKNIPEKLHVGELDLESWAEVACPLGAERRTQEIL